MTTIFQDSQAFQKLIEKNRELENKNACLEERAERSESLLAEAARAYDSLIEVLNQIRR